MDQLYPLKTKEQVPDDAERNRANAENENLRFQKITNFAKPGNPGAKFKNLFEKMIKSLSLPKAAKDELGISDDAGAQVLTQKGTEPNELIERQSQMEERKETTQMSQPNLEDEDIGERKSTIAKEKEEDKTNSDFRIKMELFGEGKYNLIPSFFRTMIYLKKAKREYAITFRTFGDDLPNTIYEFNAFCAGEHPCYNGRGGTPLVKFDGSKGTKDLGIKDRSQKALYYRYGTELSECKLVTGTLKRVFHSKLYNIYRLPMRMSSLNSTQEIYRRGQQ